MATVKEFVRNGLPPQTHAYNDPSLGPLEFLLNVMHAEHLPMSTRVDAARALLLFTEPRPASIPSPQCTIVIPPLSYEPWSEVCSPWPRSTGNHSQNPDPASKTLTRDDEAGDPQNLTTTP